MPGTADRVVVRTQRDHAVADLTAVAAGALRVIAAAVVGRSLLANGVDILLPFPPLLGR